MTANPSTRPPERIKEFVEGGTDTPFSAARMNEVIRVLNMFLNMRAGDGIRITRGGDGGMLISTLAEVPNPSDKPTPAQSPP